MKLADAFVTLLAGKDLSERESQDVFYALFSGEVPEAKAKSLLLLLAQKGETAEEVTGCLKALRRLEPPYKASGASVMDTCGTGGDNSHSINVSTLAALVIAGAGGKVAKHGNRGLSSKCGSSDLLESFGVKLDASAKKMTASIRKNGLGYFHAPFHHPIFSRMQPLRRALKTRTLFNLLGPLCNPVRPKVQLVGVSRVKDFKLYVEVFKKLGTTALLCRGLDGLDEISVTGPTEIACIKKGKAQIGMIHPQELGIPKGHTKYFTGGHPVKNKHLAYKILTGKLKGPARDLVVLNAAAGLWIAGKAKNLKEGLRKAEASLDSGKAHRVLRALVKASR
jgi:anthranilate phosphoribosyltransferase